ncbi:RING-H2 finger protein ATL77-like [Ziziphus jujuba]|uniref:RING-H2 finger protein ATL77-like n=1 Tax=Ziziphus jujuba TaxID=326968 RepID=A0A6P3ZRI8_ZIZJJ|nr:RING-H2 finger protein ATL77-like [Ziziphus jujuba]
MAATNLSVSGCHVPRLFSNAKLVIMFNQTDRVQNLRNQNQQHLIPADDYQAASEQIVNAYVPNHVLQRPNLCRSHLSYIVKARLLNVPPAVVDRLALDVVSIAKFLAARRAQTEEGLQIGYGIHVHLEVIDRVNRSQPPIDDLMMSRASRFNLSAPADFIRLVSTEHEKAFARKNGELDGECCGVCLEEFSAGVDLIRLIPCSHYYHPDCMAKWLYEHDSCPLCRRQVCSLK